MKRMIYIGFLLLLFQACACTAPAQTFSPNRLTEAEGTLHLESGETISGRITLNNEVLISPDIMVAAANEAPKRLHLLDVKGYESNGVFYELKHTENAIHPRSGFYFMKRLTPDGSAMHLYEHTERKQKGKSVYDVVYQPVYYLQLPGEKKDRVYATSNKKLAPNFHKKMSALLKGCPDLAARIAQKERGYFYNRINTTEEQRKNVLLQIITDYTACSSQ